MNLSQLKTALLSVLPGAVYHDRALEPPEKYIVWAADEQRSSLWADDKMIAQVLGGTVDYFTLDEYDANFEAIQAALNAAEIDFKLMSIQYEEETGITHYEWRWGLQTWHA